MDERTEQEVERTLIKLGRGWELAGWVAVDAGLIWVGDPCYCVTPDAESHPAKTWQEFCDKLELAPGHRVMPFTFDGKVKAQGDENANLGIAVESGYGDGCYPVYVKRNSECRVVALTVLFE